MAIWLIRRILHLHVSHCVAFILCVIGLVQLYTHCGVYNYPTVPEDALQTYLYEEVVPTLKRTEGYPDCYYGDILINKQTTNAWDVFIKSDDDFVAYGVENGSYVPTHCNPLFSVAILVTYRNRQSQLDVFLSYMHNYLRKQNIHYKIFLIEQLDKKAWNKGMLYNIGAKQALAEKFPCVILHDVDLLPLDAANLYVCAETPRHMSAAIDKFRNVLLYTSLAGGVVAIKTEQYVRVNGFSNRFENWGGEDDDFSYRLTKNNLEAIRFPRRMSRYTMLVHRQEHKNDQRRHIMRENRLGDTRADGLNSMWHTDITVSPETLYTHIGVHL